MRCYVALLVAPVVSGLVAIKGSHTDSSCLSTDEKVRAQFQAKLAGVCEEMCKEVGAYPQCSQCAGFTPPDSTPGVMTWAELLEHMDNLVYWGQDQLKSWKGQAALLQKPVMSAIAQKTETSEQACVAADLSNRMKVQAKLAGVCEEMCKEVGAYPQCSQCKGFTPPDSTPGVFTWAELLEHMDNLVYWGQDQLKSWKGQAGLVQKTQKPVLSALAEQSCVSADQKMRAQFQAKLAGVCEDMCKEVGAYPQCSQCKGFTPPDSTPGVMTWAELLEHMDNLVYWGQDQLKGWHAQAGLVQKTQKPVLSAIAQKTVTSEQACADAEAKVDLEHRMQLQAKLAGVCEEMCKEVGAYPNCAQCKGFVPPDSTPGVMTWAELLEHMDNLVYWGQDQLKGWHQQSSALQISRK